MLISGSNTSRQLLQSHASCTRKCRSSFHASACMRSAMRAETLHQMQCFLLLTCRNFYNQHDERHRSLVHWTAASGNVALLDWLVEQFHVDVNHKVRCIHSLMDTVNCRFRNPNRITRRCISRCCMDTSRLHNVSLMWVLHNLLSDVWMILAWRQYDHYR